MCGLGIEGGAQREEERGKKKKGRVKVRDSVGYTKGQKKAIPTKTGCLLT